MNIITWIKSKLINLSVGALSLLILNDICLLSIVNAFLPNSNTKPKVKSKKKE